MLKMAQQQYIKHLYEMEEKSLAEMAKITKLNYRTVRKYALKDDWSKAACYARKSIFDLPV